MVKFYRLLTDYYNVHSMRMYVMKANKRRHFWWYVKLCRSTFGLPKSGMDRSSIPTSVLLLTELYMKDQSCIQARS